MKKMRTISCAIIGSLVAMSASATLYVNYDEIALGATTRAVDSTSSTAAQWNFSDTTALASGNRTIYGGFKASWDDNFATYEPGLNFQTGRIQIAVNPTDTNVNNKAMTGMFVWKKENFLNGGDSVTIDLEANTGSMSYVDGVQNASNYEQRWVVQQGGQYYVSQSTFGDATLTIADLGAESWATISTDNNYTIGGTFTDIALTDVTAIGLYFDADRLNNVNRLFNRVENFQFDVIPEPATLGLVAAMGGSILFIRRRFMM